MLWEINGQYRFEVLNLANGELIRSIESHLPLPQMLHEFTNDGSLYAFEETTEHSIPHYQRY